MKLTTQRLKQIIREEIEEALRTGPPPERAPLKLNRGKKMANIKFPPPGQEEFMDDEEEMEDSTVPANIRYIDKAPPGKFKGIKFKDADIKRARRARGEETEFERDERLRDEMDSYIGEYKTIQKRPKKYKLKKMSHADQAKRRQAEKEKVTKVKTVTPGKDAIKGPTAATPEDPQKAARDKLYSRTGGPKELYRDPKTGKLKARMKMSPDDAEHERQKMYAGEGLSKEDTSSLEERIFKMLVDKINGASK